MERPTIRGKELALIFELARLSLNLSVQEAATLSKIKPEEITRIESGDLSLPISTYLTLCEFYKLPIFEEFDIIL